LLQSPTTAHSSKICKPEIILSSSSVSKRIGTTASSKIDEFVPNIFGLRKDQLNQTMLLSDRMPAKDPTSPKALQPRMNSKRLNHRAKNLTVLGMKTLKSVGEPYIKQMRKQNPELLPESLFDIRLDQRSPTVLAKEAVIKLTASAENKREELD